MPIFRHLFYSIVVNKKSLNVQLQQRAVNTMLTISYIYYSLLLFPTDLFSSTEVSVLSFPLVSVPSIALIPLLSYRFGYDNTTYRWHALYVREKATEGLFQWLLQRWCNGFPDLLNSIAPPFKIGGFIYL